MLTIYWIGFAAILLALKMSSAKLLVFGAVFVCAAWGLLLVSILRDGIDGECRIFRGRKKNRKKVRRVPVSVNRVRFSENGNGNYERNAYVEYNTKMNAA